MTYTDELFAEKLEPIVRLLSRVIENGRQDDAALASFINATQSLPLKVLPSLEAKIRSASWIQPRPIRIARNTTFSDVFRFSKENERHRFVLPWFDLFSYDGFRRERALRVVKEGAPNAFLLAVLFRRLNDWVPQVRLAAREAVDVVLAKTETSLIVEALWYTLPSRGSIRRLQRAEVLVLDQIPVRKEVAEALAERLKTASAGPGLSVLRQALRQPGLEQYLPDLARSSVQPAVRAAAYKALIEQKVGWHDGWEWKWVDKSLGLRERQPVVFYRSFSIDVDLAGIVEQAIADRSVFVKRVGGDGLIANRDKLRAHLPKLAIRLAQDKSASVAKRGEFLLRSKSTT